MTAAPSTSTTTTATKRRRNSSNSAAKTSGQTAAQELAAAAPATSATAATPAASTSAAAAALAERLSATAAIQLPDLDAPSLSPLQPAVSYKLAFSDTTRFYRSTDGGHTTEPTSSPAIAGAVIDLALQISPAHNRSGENYRLRLAFLELSGTLSELNLNAVSTAADGSTYITSPARSLTGALLAIADAADDMQALCSGARFSIRKGTGRGVFLETDIVVSGRWLAMSGPAATLRVAKDPAPFCQQLCAIKERFRSCGLLLPGAAVIHTGESEQGTASGASAPQR